MGERGPPPKRDSQRRRRNKPETPTTTAPGAVSVEVPPADPGWHPLALDWYESLAGSGQAVYYQPSDWATARLVAESLSRDLNPQVVGVTDAGPIEASIPLKGASLAAYLKAMSSLMVTEGDRRRMRLELDPPNRKGATGEGDGSVSYLDEARRGRQPS